MEKYQLKNLPNYDPHTHTHTKWPKSWGYVDFTMAANENALTLPKFDLAICGIIQNVFQGD